MAGTTHDPVDSETDFENRNLLLVDTAGIRRGRAKAAQSGSFERSVAEASIDAVERCHVAVLVVDAQPSAGIQDAEQRLASAIATRKCSVVVESFCFFFFFIFLFSSLFFYRNPYDENFVFSFATPYRSVKLDRCNKWDLVHGQAGFTPSALREEVRARLKFLPYAPVLPISARDNIGVEALLRTVVECFDERSFRFSTSKINRIVDEALAVHQPPAKGNRRLTVSFVTQSAQYPPTFILWCNDPKLVHFSYERYLENHIRSVHPFRGTPLTFVWRQKKQKSKSPAPVSPSAGKRRKNSAKSKN